MQHLNKKLTNYFVNNYINNYICVYKTKNVVYFVKEIKNWKEIILERREPNGNYLFMARIEINSNMPEGYNFVRQRQFENNIKYVFNLILLNRLYKHD